MAIAIISDIHANIEAFKAVLADIEDQNLKEIVCLGDIIGYGPKPIECLELAKDFNFSLLGNHEEAVLFGAVGFNSRAKMAIDWTRDQLNSGNGDPEKKKELWNFLGDLKIRVDEGNVSYVHGSPREPTREYIFQRDILDQAKMEEIFANFEEICFNGHTHTPGILTDRYQFISPKDCDYEYTVEEGVKALTNVGSVGQPRDGDNRGCYVIFDGKKIIYRRVEYNVEATVEQISKIKELPEYLGLRLREGR